MNLALNNYAIVLLVSGLFTLIMAFFLMRRRGSVSYCFGLNMVFTSLWAIAYSFELSSQTITDMLFWINIEYIGITMLPITWIAFIIFFTDKINWITKSRVALLFLFPTITLFIVFTNNFHHLYYTSVSLDITSGFPLIDLHLGIWYKIFTIYFYLNLAGGSYLLFTAFKKQRQIYRRQKDIILVAVIIPWFANLLYILGFRPNHHIDLTPYAFITSSILIGFGLLRFSLFDIVPVARERIVEAFRDGVLVLNIHNRVIDVNGKMKQILLLDESEQIVGSKLENLLPGFETLHKVVAGREVTKIEIDRQIDDETRIFEIDTTPLFSKNNIFTGSIILFRDITERKNSEQRLNNQSEELKNLNQLKDKLFFIIAHDLRGPIMNLKLLVNMIETGMITDEEFKSFLPQLAIKLGYTSGLLENLLNWSKTQLDGQKIERSVFDLYTIAESEIKYCIQKASEKGITIIDEVSSETMVFADARMMEFVIRNILSNAIKFSSKGDEIKISCSKNNERELTVCIKDTGSGIKSEQLQKLFLPETFTTRGTNNEQGTGLGLQLCKDFVEKNDGKIWATSEVTSGTSIFFTIPSPVVQESFLPIEAAAVQIAS